MRPRLLTAGLGLLLLAWLFASPLDGVPDETAHYYKALGASYGQWSGRPAIPVTPELGRRDRFLATMSREFRVPARYAVQTGMPGERLECVTFNPASAACQYGTRALPPVRTPVPVPGVFAGIAPTGPPPIAGVLPSYVGGYPPYVYLPAGLATRLTRGGPDGLRAARAVFAGLCLLMLAGAARCCRERASAVALLAAVTPMTVFLSAAVNTSGPEITGALCAIAAALAVARDPARPEAWAWLAAGAVVLATSRVPGPVWLVLLAVVLAAALGRSGVRIVRRRPWPALACAAVAGTAAGATLAWDAVALPAVHASRSQLIEGLVPAARNVPGMLIEMVGRFGWIDTPMPTACYVAAVAAQVGLLAMALVAGTRAQRALLGIAVLVAVLATVGVDALTQRPFGFASQGRYSLAVAVAVPLLSGHVLVRRGGHLPAWVLPAGLPLVAAGALTAQLGGWYAQAHHYAVGLRGPVLFVTAPQWQPPGGWLPWICCLLVGSALLGWGALCGPGPATDPGRA